MDMKKLLLALLLIPTLAFAGDIQLARLSPAVVGGGVPVAAGGPDAWYDSGTYSTTSTAAGGAYNGMSLTVGEAGTATKLRSYVGHEDETGVKIALYDSSGNLVTGCGGGNCTCTIADLGATGWHECTLPGTGVSVTATTYWVFRVSDANVYRGLAAAGTGCYGAEAYATFPAATKTITGCDGSNYLVGVYVD